MKNKHKIITVGLAPCWDITVQGGNLNWGGHKVVDSITSRPAGKALNISRALAWLGTKSILAGLWGETDYSQMRSRLQPLKQFIGLKHTVVAGTTRNNVTVIDTAKRKEMHLRSVSDLATKKSLRRLQAELGKIVTSNSICVFAGSIPPVALCGEVDKLIETCAQKGAKVVLDTSGAALRRLTDSGYVCLIKPNVEELRELLRADIPDTPAALKKAGENLLSKVDMVLISRGKKGAVLVTMEGSFTGRAIFKGGKIVSTVGCGDYLLAGFLYGLKENESLDSALKTAIKTATARALGWTQEKPSPAALEALRIKLQKLSAKKENN